MRAHSLSVTGITERRDIDDERLARGIARIRIRIADRTCDADDGLLLAGVIVENPIAFPDRPQVFLRERVSDTGPHGLPILFELIVCVVFRFLFDEPLGHAPT